MQNGIGALCVMSTAHGGIFTLGRVSEVFVEDHLNPFENSSPMFCLEAVAPLP